MSKSTINIFVGGAGTSVGQHFLQASNNSEKIFVADNEVPECLRGNVTHIQSKRCRNSFFDGYQQNDVSFSLLSALRNEIERHESTPGIQIVHSTCGGTGSGVVSNFLPSLRDFLPNAFVHTCSLFSSHGYLDCVLQPYTEALTLGMALIDHTDLTSCFSTEAALHTLLKKTAKPTHEHVNGVFGRALACIESPVASQMLSWTEYRDFFLYNRHRDQHFLTTRFTPIAPTVDITDVTDVVDKLFENESLLISPQRSCRSTACQLVICDEQIKAYGEISKHCCENARVDFRDSFSGGTPAAACISNSDHVVELFNTVCKDFDALWERKAFLHYFNGITEEMTESRMKLDELIKKYQ
ncbi:hypothetical protein PCE1_004387 [Barthelona sp. PCE]